MSRHCEVGETYPLDLLKYLPLWEQLLGILFAMGGADKTQVSGRILYEEKNDLMLYLWIQYEWLPFPTQKECEMSDQNFFVFYYLILIPV